jgi:hypothetical protein
MRLLRTANRALPHKTDHTMALSRAKVKDLPQLDATIRLKVVRLPLTRALRITSRGENREINRILSAVAET